MAIRSLAVADARVVREPVQETIKRVRFAKKNETKQFQVPSDTGMTEYFAVPRNHNGSAKMPTKEALNVAGKLACGRAKRLRAQAGGGARMCLPAAGAHVVPDCSLKVNRT